MIDFSSDKMATTFSQVEQVMINSGLQPRVNFPVLPTPSLILHQEKM
jgi:hypothetical protein